MFELETYFRDLFGISLGFGALRKGDLDLRALLTKVIGNILGLSFPVARLASLRGGRHRVQNNHLMVLISPSFLCFCSPG